ncbi:MAG: hypothetical protein JNM93_00935 [Bacteriovoracaceae bacterium]|nr:hypothetical protein [Bacteriovoracaceae bacterium]
MMIKVAFIFTLMLFGFAQAGTVRIDQKEKTLFYLETNDDMHTQDKQVILHWMNKFVGEDLVVIETEPYSKPIEKYYLGFKGNLKIALKYLDYDYKYQEYLAKKLCEKMKCDFVYRGDDLVSYSYPEFWDHKTRFKENLPEHFIKNEETLTFSTKLSSDTRRVLFQKLDYRVVYWGQVGKVLYYNKDETAEANYENKVGSFISKNTVDYRIKDVILNQQKIKALVENSNADCAYTQFQDALSFCMAGDVNKLAKPPKTLPAKSRLSLRNGFGELEIFESTAQESLTRPILHDSHADTVYDPEFVTIYYKEKPETYESIKSYQTKYSWLNNYDNMLIEYRDGDDIVAKIKLKDLNKKDMERIHELMVESLNPDTFNIYEWKYDNQLALVGQFQPEIIPALNQSTIRKMQERSTYSIGTRFENRYLGISADNAINFIDRKTSDAFSFYSIYGEWWGRSATKWGVKGHVNVFTYQYGVNNGLGTTDANGNSGEYNLMAGYRKKVSSPYADEIRFFAGPSKKHILITSNLSIGSLKYLNMNLQAEAVKQRGKYIFSTELQASRIMKANTEMAGQATSGGEGMWYHVSSKVSYPIYKNLFLSGGGLYRQGTLDFKQGGARLKEFGFYLGLDFISVGF